MLHPATHQHHRASPRRPVAAWLAGLLALVAGLGFAPLASADPPKSITQKWRNTGSCAWDFPGANTYMGMVAPSVERYADIPPSVRTKLRSRMDKQAYDDFVVITRNGIVGRHMYEPVIGNMQFGSRLICGQVTRTRWKDDHIERGLVYCESGTCLMVPTTGRNISRVKRKPQMVATAQAPAPESQTEEPKEPDLLDGLAPPAAGPAGTGGGGAGGGGGGGFASPVAPTFTQVASNGFSPVPSFTPYSGTAGTGQTTSTGSGDGTGTGGGTGGIGGDGGGTIPGGSTGGNTGGGSSTGGTTSPIPEPETYALMLMGLALLAGVSRAKKRD